MRGRHTTNHWFAFLLSYWLYLHSFSILYLKQIFFVVASFGYSFVVLFDTEDGSRIFTRNVYELKKQDVTFLKIVLVLSHWLSTCCCLHCGGG
jgi:hypothetical protein